MLILPCFALLLTPALELSKAATNVHVARSDCTALLESVEEMIARGRKLYSEGKLDEALVVFESAEKQDSGSMRTRVFVLRTWIAQGRIEDALGECDLLKKTAKTGVELDYLYGMGFYSMAARDMAADQTTAVTGSQFEDALGLLQRACAVNDPRFEDAWRALAESAWYAANIEVGASASVKAVELSPADPTLRMLRGKLALQAYALLRDDPAQASPAEVQWQAALAAFKAAIALFGDSPTGDQRSAAQQAQMQLATTHLWKQQAPDASVAFAKAIALDPDSADYPTISAALNAQDFLDTLVRAQQDWNARLAASGGENAALLWWTGFANYGVKRFPQAARAFESALAKQPAFINTWYYLFRVRYDQQEFAKCMESLHQYDLLDAPGLLASLAFDVPGNTARLEFLVGWNVEPDNHAGTALNLEAAFLCERITQIVPRDADNSRHWNNLGLFLRDEGDAIRGTQGALEPAPAPFDEAKVNRLWEDALVAYEVSLELEPKNPNYLNDTAVMLHYYLLRDFERALLLYQQGFVEATELLKRTDLTPTRRAEVKIAERDTRNNVKLVQQLIDKRAAQAAAAKGSKPANQ